MKKEFITLLQFILITVFVGYGYFGLLLIQKATVLSLWDEYEELLINWIFSFIILSIIRLAVYYFISRKKSYNSDQASSQDLIGKEISRTIQYVIFAVISFPIAFYMTLPFAPGISINIGEVWRSFQGVFYAWLIGFLMQSLLRLGIIYIKNKFFQDKYIAKN